MTPDVPLLTKQDVAAERGVEVPTISRYLAVTRARVAAGLPLRPMDLPEPEPAGTRVERGTDRPVWRADGPIRQWIARRNQNQEDTA